MKKFKLKSLNCFKHFPVEILPGVSRFEELYRPFGPRYRANHCQIKDNCREILWTCLVLSLVDRRDMFY